MSPWCARFTPQPGSLSAGARYQRSWKLGVAPGVPPAVHVGTVEKTCRMIGLETETPLTVAVKVPLLASLKAKDTVPTWVAATCAASKGTLLNAGPVVR